MRKNSLIVLLILLLSVPCFATTPEISGVTGTVAQGNTLTVSGTTMLDENKTDWIDATSQGGPNFTSGDDYGFEAATWESDLFPASPDSNNERVISHDSTVKLMGNRSLKGYDAGASSGANMLSTGAYFYTLNANEYYIRLYSRWNVTGTPAWPTDWSKFIDIPGTGEMWYWQPVAGYGTPTQMNMRYNDTDHNDTIPNFMQEDRWYCMEARFKVNATSNFTTWIDGTQIRSASPTLGRGVHLGWILFNGPNYSGTNSDFTISVWSDNLTVSTSRVYCSTMVEICNSGTYAGATCVKQPLTTISDTSIVFTADLTGLGDGPYYLWVTNNKQERSDAYNLSGGGTVPSLSGCTLSGASMQ